ncbi:MAG: STAS domain-containing protein [Chitinivorax sp.]
MNAGQRTVAMGDSLTIYAVAELRNKLLQELATCRDLVLDMDAVAEVDAAGLQLLVALKHQALFDGCELSLVNHSAELRQALELFGLNSFFGDPQLIPAKE